jgi:hypothetical protein
LRNVCSRWVTTASRIVKDYLRAVRQNSKGRRAYVRVEPAAGERFDIDWGHFGTLIYNGATRNLARSWPNMKAAWCAFIRASWVSPASMV